jgi:RNA polymerase sigma-70 factor (ECF subfamily)
MLSRMRAGLDQRAWEEFSQAYGPMLLAFCNQRGLSDIDADDTVQEVLLAVLNHFRGLSGAFDRSKGRFKAWLKGIAFHKLRDQQRRAAREQRRVQSRAHDTPTDWTAPNSEDEQAFELEWQRNQLWLAMNQLRREVDPAAYQAFEAYVLHGQPVKKVARLLGISHNAVYIRKSRMLSRLRQLVRQLEEETD